MDAMDAKMIMWASVLLGLTVAYGVACLGAHEARKGNVQPHSRWMLTMSTMIGVWLVAYLLKQLLFGTEQFRGPGEQYRQWYLPILSVHIALAFVTIGLGVANLYTGLSSLRFGIGAGAMRAGVGRHRLLGRLLMWSLSGTMLTAYAVFFMLFVLYPPQ
jgi:putative membrane protein